MNRREFVAAIAGAASLPFYPAGAQQSGLPIVGWLHSASPTGPYSSALNAFRAGLREKGFVEGHSVLIDYQWAHDHYERLPVLADDLVRKNVSLIMVGGGDVSVLAAKSATATIPIVFAIGADPARIGIVDSFNLPGGNITGVSFLSVQIRPKMVELIKELLPNATTIAVLENPHRPHFQQSSSEVTQSAQSAGLQVEVVQASNAREIDAAFLRLQHMRVDALLVMSDPAFINRSTQIVELLTAYRLPSILATRDFVRAGGLLSYGASLDDSYHDAGVYAGRILVGEKPATMPVKQPTKFELSINLKTAKSLGIVVPAALLARADEVIE